MIRSRYADVSWTELSEPIDILNWRSGMVAASRASLEMPTFALLAGVADAAVAPAGETTTVIAAVARVSKARLSLRTASTALAWLGWVNPRK